MDGTRPPGFLDRASECDVLDRVLVDLRSGSSVAVVIRGEAGIGKTTLLRYAARRAAGIRLAHVTGVEVEMELPFAGVHQLCVRMLHRLDTLPKPQRDALSIALGLSAGEPPERFLVGLAVLSLLSAVAEEQPLLCLVEDAQWLDPASAQVLGFASRRVLAESVAIVVAIDLPSQVSSFIGRAWELEETVGLRDRAGFSTWTTFRRGQAQVSAEIRQTLGDDRFGHAVAAGSRLGQHEVVAAIRDRRGERAQRL